MTALHGFRQLRPAVDGTAFHDERDASESADVFDRIAWDGDNICEIARLERADFVLPTEELCPIQKSGLEHVERFHTVLRHQDVLPRLRAVGKGADVRADSHGHTGSELLAEFLNVQIVELMLALGSRGSRGMVGEIFGDRKGGNGEDLLLLHEAHGFVAQLVGMIDGDDAGLHGVEGARLTGGMDGDVLANTSGFLNGGGELCLGILIRSRKVAIADRVAAGLVDLDEVGAFFELLANDGDKLFGGVGVSGVREDVLLGIETVGVFVTAKDVDSVAADAQTRTGDQAGVYGVAHGAVGRAGSLRAHVALSGEAGEKIFASGLRGDDGALWDGLLDGLQIFRTGMKEEMDMRVNETGEERDVAEVDDPR